MTAFFGTELKLIVLLSALSLSDGEFLVIKSKTKASQSDKIRYSLRVFSCLRSIILGASFPLFKRTLINRTNVVTLQHSTITVP